MRREGFPLKTREDGLCYTAALEGNATNVAAYLKRGADIQALSRSIVLQEVARRGHLHVLQILIDAGADVNAKDHDTGITALMQAARYGHIECMRYLLERGASVGETAEERYHTIAWAVTGDNGEVANILLDNGIDPNAHSQDGYSALMMAASRGSVESLRAMLARGARVNAATPDGMTALRCARRYGRAEAETVLKEAGAEEPPLSPFGRWRDRLLIPVKQRLFRKRS